jgi:DNA-binding Lrp family transcriptional regulator
VNSVELRVFGELLRDSKRSDREIAKLLGVSQPTVTRLRHRLVKDGWVRQFTVVPGFVKLGFRILVFSLFESRLRRKESGGNGGLRLLSKPNVVFAAECNGMGMNGVVVSLHRSYSEYVDFVRELRSEGGDGLKMADSLIISLEGSVIKPFDLKDLVKTLHEKDV